ncbi:hypothetical protein PQJ75_23825 [Rhodoplanes sp. TEM]|uniref:NarX-like N-terminal domain-containing protein n=1 Tax=Rhodoplanes tepidamans TaxID=200616 RepID=A0ABT5JL52_RHOTP|nr:MULTISPECIES: hypothetical protein [Rhodoplanes]MDC7789949.1 hypothetical protein [Rhodoplanes tepidamans]MDC7986770.1 hypothetical protein [Rhodoplanes sp. TEM]MDQ0357750.1 hypothetical protein [Rhodoplanes tepidamans]
MRFFPTLPHFPAVRSAVRTTPLLITSLLLLASAAPALAQAPLAAADEAVLADRRLAAGYLRTGNGDLAALALERLQKALPAPHAMRAKTAVEAIDAGDLAAATTATEALAVDLAEARRAAGVRVLADCVREFSTVYATLDTHRTRAPDLADAALRSAIAAAARASDAAVARCDGEAPAAVKADAGFRRLVDGSRGSLGRIPEAVAAGDAELLHRFLIELRAYEQLLRFRYG